MINEIKEFYHKEGFLNKAFVSLLIFIGFSALFQFIKNFFKFDLDYEFITVIAVILAIVYVHNSKKIFKASIFVKITEWIISIIVLIAILWWMWQSIINSHPGDGS